MIKENQELQDKSKAREPFFKNLSAKTKLFFSSLIILIIGFFSIKFYKKNEHDNDEDLSDSNNKISENKKNIEEIENNITLYSEEIDSISKEINNVIIDIKNIESEEAKEKTLDQFFDERVKW